MTMSATSLIDINELSFRLKIAKGTIYNWCYLRRIPYRKVGRALRFNPDEVDLIARKMAPLDRADRGRRSF
jgi:excisionase family DNA binding protein